MFTIAVSGQFDRLTSKFVNFITHREDLDCRVVGIAPSPYRDIHHLGWRLGSLMSLKDASGMLEGVDALVVFCMTPPNPARTAEGMGLDVALASAVNLAKIVQTFPQMRVILVMRGLPDAPDEKMELYDYWYEVRRIFEERCHNLCVLECDPILNELDALTLSMVERICSLKQTSVGMTDNRIRPISMHQFLESIETALVSSDSRCRVCGAHSISWREWFETASRAISFGHKLKYAHRLQAFLNAEGQQRERLLAEAVRIRDDFEEESADKVFLKRMYQITADLLEDSIPRILSLEPERSHDIRHTCYVQSLVANSRRSVSDTTDLLMQWLPRYFKHAVRVDELGMGKLACRLGFVPLMDLEKIVESETRCRVQIRFPWGRNALPPTSLVLMTTGLCGDLRRLLIIVEDAPNSHLLITGFRAMMVAFGMYLKEYA